MKIHSHPSDVIAPVRPFKSDNDQHEWGNASQNTDRKRKGYSVKAKVCRKCGLVRLINDRFQSIYMNQQSKQLIEVDPGCMNFQAHNRHLNLANNAQA